MSPEKNRSGIAKEGWQETNEQRVFKATCWVLSLH